MKPENDKAFDKQIESQVKWLSDGIKISDSTPKLRQAWKDAREQEMFYRATDYRGS